MLINTRRDKILGILGAITLAASGGQAAHAQLSVSKCTVIAEPSGTPADVAQVCGRLIDPAVAEPFNGAERGFAYFHAANAYARLNNPVVASDLVAQSYANLTDASPSLSPAAGETRPKNKKKAKEWDERIARQNAFKFNRTILRASSLRQLGDQFASGQISTNDTTLCSDKTSCIDSAISFLNAQGGVIVPYLATATTPEGQQVDRFHFLKAELIEARNRGSDKADALSAYEAVMGGNSASPEEAKAKAKVESLGIELGNTARAPVAAPVSEQSLSDAVGFYTRALKANPASTAALLGKGGANLERASLTSVRDPDRRAYYAEAVSAFTAASGSAAAGSANYGAAAFQLGSAKAAWADYLTGFSPKTPADNVKLAELRRESVTHFEAATTASPTEAPYLRALATAYKAKGEPQKAEVAYRKAIAALLGSTAGAAWDVPRTDSDRAAFSTRVSALPKSDREFISGALIDLGATTSVSADLLLAAKLADSTSVKPALQLAELYAKSGNTSSARQEIAYVLTKSEVSAGVVRAGMEADRATAYFLRSTLAAKPTPTLEAINDADNALKLQPANAAYANWACVTRILAGGDYVKGANISSGCVGLIGEEREVLRGMFLLRAAALAPASQKQTIRNQAQMVFGQGHARLGQDTEYRAKSGVFPWWTQNAEATKLRPLLLYGEAAAITCAGAPWNPDITRDEINLAVSFYNWHKANDC